MRKLLLPLLMILAIPAGAQEYRVSAAAGSKLSIVGTSNVHAWESSTSDVSAMVTGELSAPSKATVSISVKTLKSGKGGLDNNLYKALNADKFPTITFSVTGFDPTTGKTNGTLAIAGTSKPVTFTTTPSTNPDGGIRVKGSTTLLMTDFGIKPPTALMGTIKCGNEVKIVFDIILNR